MARTPTVGETISCEMGRSFMVFIITKVKRCSDPPDMFFADVKAVKQEDK